MALTNSQYNTILRMYEEKQTQNRHEQSRRRQEIYDKIPEYEQIEQAVSSVSIKQGHRLLDGDSNALMDLKSKLQQLSQKKAALLSSHGFPPDYLEPVYACNDCKDTGYIENKKCHCLKQKIISYLYEQSNIKEVLEQENFSVLSSEFYEGEDLTRFRAAVSACQNFIDAFSSTYRNLFLYGSVGAGKTFLSNCIAKELIEQGFSVIYFSAISLFEILSKNSFASKSREDLYNLYQELYNCDLLVIDDLGTEYTNAFITSQLFSYLNERHLRKKSTIISTNLSLEELRNHYSERIFSRITSNYDIYKITGPDIRMYRKTKLNRK